MRSPGAFFGASPGVTLGSAAGGFVAFGGFVPTRTIRVSDLYDVFQVSLLSSVPFLS